MESLVSDAITQACAQAEVDGRPLQGHEADWDGVLSRCAYAPVSHTRHMIVYQQSYVVQAGVACIDASLVIFQAGQPVGVWPLCLRRRGEKWEIGSNEGGVLPPLFISGLGARLEKSLAGKMVEIARNISRCLGINEWFATESFMGCTGLGSWHTELMEHGASCAVSHELYLSLAPELAQIKSGLRKSYKALLTQAAGLWSAEVLRGVCVKEFDEFRDLHRQVAGRSTRADATWQEQMRALQDHAAFMVILRNAEQRMVGCGFFAVSPHEALYAVGVYDRSLFDRPVGHLVQWRAIEEMKNLGLKWYKLGARPYPGDRPAPADKDLSIALFKQGFASDVLPRYEFACKVSDVPSPILDSAESA